MTPRILFVLVGLMLASPVSAAQIAGGGSGSTTSIVTAATTYYVSAKSAGGTSVYNGDAGTIATPSDSNDCTTKATPCATIAGVASKLNGKILAAVVTVQLADTAGTGTDCYRPNKTVFNISTLTKEVSSSMEIGGGGAGLAAATYPAAYLYVLGNTTTPSNVKVTGATTCAGTTATDAQGIVLSNVVARVRGLQFQYFNTGTAAFGGAVDVYSSMIFAEDNYCVGSTAVPGAYMFGVYKGEIQFGNSIQSAITACQVVAASNESQITTISPLGRANLAITTTGWTWNAGIFLINELSHMGIDGASISITGTGTGTAYMIIASGSLTWNDNTTFTAPTQTHSYQGNGLTLINALQGSYVNDLCRTAGSLVCNIGTVTTIAYRARADTASFVTYVTRGTVTNADTVTKYSTVIGQTNSWFAPGATTFANLGTPANGIHMYCSDCTIANPCAGAGTGSFAKRLNGVWVCN